MDKVLTAEARMFMDGRNGARVQMYELFEDEISTGVFKVNIKQDRNSEWQVKYVIFSKGLETEYSTLKEALAARDTEKITEVKCTQ